MLWGRAAGAEGDGHDGGCGGRAAAAACAGRAVAGGGRHGPQVWPACTRGSAANACPCEQGCHVLAPLPAKMFTTPGRHLVCEEQDLPLPPGQSELLLCTRVAHPHGKCKAL